MNKKMFAHASGGVQMVGYRDFTQKAAKMLGITGTVENLEDGMVEIVAEGYGPALILFREILKIGPRGSNVTGLSHEFEKKLTGFKDFSTIRPTYFATTPPISTGTNKFWKKNPATYKKEIVVYKQGLCPTCGIRKDFRVEGSFLVCIGCGVWFASTEIIQEATVKKPRYVHQPDQYQKGSQLREDGNCMLHQKAMRELGYKCSCDMCQRANEIWDEAEISSAVRSAQQRKPFAPPKESREAKKWI